MLRLAIERISDNSWDNSKHWLEIIHALLIAIVIVALAIPEGLPLSVTLSLAYSVKKML